MPDLSKLSALFDHWFIACRSSDLRRRPLARVLLGNPIVLFRTRTGTAAALRDMCPHRNVPLSAGAVSQDNIVCRYHGWRFGGDGRCNAVPGLGPEKAAERRSRKVPAYATREQDGFVWVYGTPDKVPLTEPYTFAYLGRKGFRSIQVQFDITAELPDVLENFLDTTHTHFLHRRKIRRDNRRLQTTVIVHRNHESVTARYLGDGQESGLIGRIFRGGVDTSIDRFRLPAVVELEHLAATRLVLLISIFLTPQTDSSIRAYAVACGRTDPLRALLARTLGMAILSRVIREDCSMLRLQFETKQRHEAGHPTSTQLDFMRPHLLRLLRNPAGAPPDENASHERTLRLFI